MEFLPIEKDGARVYAGFWPRFGALWVDALVLLPFVLASRWLQSVSMPLAILGTIADSAIFLGYTIYFHYRYGATLGKMATGVKVTLSNGSPVGLKQAFLRSSVETGFTFLSLVATVIAILHADPEQYLPVGWNERAEHVASLFPAWHMIVGLASAIWGWSEVIVLLFNKRRRALHDFIAGTIVIYKEHAAGRDGRPDAVDATYAG